MDPKILVINCGSSSVKVSLFDKELRRLKEFKKESLQDILEELKDENLNCIGHRVVHGGEKYEKPTLLDKSILNRLEELKELAPLHNPPSIAGIRISHEFFPNVRQVAVFDTAFHKTIPLASSLYPIPLALSKKYKIKRYGFHGIAHAFLAHKYQETFPDSKNGKLLTLHLGSGASIAAIDKGASIDTSMGFTPLEGLMMSTRSGSIDPSIVEFLCEKEKKSPKSILELLNRDSGLLGVSEETGDLKKLLTVNSENSRLARTMFQHSLLRNTGALLAILGKPDALIFSGGIGENDPEIRKGLLESLSWIGITLDPIANQNVHSLNPGEMREISNKNSTPKVLVIASDENYLIAKNCKDLRK